MKLKTINNCDLKLIIFLLIFEFKDTLNTITLYINTIIRYYFFYP